jgi:selenocysteine-specific elongation factor
MKSIIIGTAGHIDHGKTALVKALTGVDTDRLPEEKARGITIDLGFAHVNWEGFDISFIDVPGHEKFVKNMLAGIGGIDLLMLVVAADESIMPQTREHFDICRLLSISSGIVAITKLDLVDAAALELVRRDVHALVRGSFLEGAPVLAVSAKTGEGVDAIQKGILGLLNSIPQREPKGIFRLPVDRVFTLKGRGTVITGTLMSGRIPKDSPAEILPSHRKTKVRSVHAHNQNVPEAFAGQRTALNLQGIEKEEIHRGDVLSEPGFLESTSLLDAKITLLANSRPLLHNSLVRFHHLTTDVLARVTVLGRESIPAGESGFVQLRLQRPVIAVHNDRFILRRQSPLITIGGGSILDAMPTKRVAKGDSTAFERLKKLEHASTEERCAIAVAEKGLTGADEVWLKAKLALPVSEILKLQTDEIVILNDQPLLAISKYHEGLLFQKIVDAVTSFHQSNPLLPGIPKEELLSKFLSFVPVETFLAILERGISVKKIQLVKGIVAVFGRKVSLSSEEEELASRTEDFLLRIGLEFPGFDKIAEELKQRPEETKKLIYLLVRQGKVIKIAEDYFLHPNNWDELKQRIRGLKSARKTFTVPDFKTFFGITRKYAIPLLEQLDREGVTRRSGNERIIL